MKYATIYRLLFFMVFVALLAGTGCISNERLASKRVSKLIERFPNIIDTLTVDTVETTVYQTEYITSLDTAYLDRVILEACDTVFKDRQKLAYKYLYRNCAKDTVKIFEYKTQTITKNVVIPCQQLCYWTGLRYEYPWILAILFLLVVLFLIKR
jgi:hypothetical protein